MNKTLIKKFTLVIFIFCATALAGCSKDLSDVPTTEIGTQDSQDIVFEQEQDILTNEPFIGIETQPSQGLVFKTNNDGTCGVDGIGTCEDTILNIPTKSRQGDVVIEIDEGAFGSVDACPFVETVNIASTVKSIGAFAFDGCEIKKVYISNSVKNIDEFAFRSCKQLEEVIFYSSGDTIIGEGAFSETSSLKEIKIPEGVIFMYEGCFAESGIEKIELPVSLQKVGAYAFSQCKNLKQITYAGTRADWMGVEVSSIAWNLSSATEIVCSDGVYEIKR